MDSNEDVPMLGANIHQPGTSSSSATASGVAPPPLAGDWQRRQRRRTSSAQATGMDVDSLASSPHGTSLGDSTQVCFYCPVGCCAASDPARRGGWGTFDGLRMPAGMHIDAHMLLQIPGRPSADWLRERRLHSCSHCTRLVSVRFEMHRTCRAQLSRMSEIPIRVPQHQGLGAQDADLAVLEELPSLDEICSAFVDTRDFVGFLLAKAAREFWRCVSAAVQHDRADAWDHVGTPADLPSHKRTRLAWTEL